MISYHMIFLAEPKSANTNFGIESEVYNKLLKYGCFHWNKLCTSLDSMWRGWTEHVAWEKNNYFHATMLRFWSWLLIYDLIYFDQYIMLWNVIEHFSYSYDKRIWSKEIELAFNCYVISPSKSW